MKTLSIQQPWASLICAGIKDVENRTWKAAKVPGRILIHASSKKVPRTFFNNIPEEMESYISNNVFFGNLAPLNELPTSAIIGYVTVTGFEDSAMDSVWADGPGVIKWKLEDAWMFDEPILNVKGKLNLFDYDDIDENNLPPAHQVELENIELNDNEDEVVVPCYDIPFKELGEGKNDHLQLYLTEDLKDLLCVYKDNKLGMKPFKTITLTCGDKYKKFELTEETEVYMMPDLDDKTNPYIIMYHNGKEEIWLTAEFFLGNKIDEGEFVMLDGNNIIHEFGIEHKEKQGSNKNIIKFTVNKSMFNDIINGQFKVFTKEIRPNTQSLYCIMDEDGYVKEINGVMQLRKYDAIQFVCRNESYTCEINNADIELLEDQDGNQITYEEKGEEYMAAQIVYTLGEEIK